MTVDVHDIASHAEWLELRKHDITASVAGALLGVHEWTTVYGLHALKSGQVTEDIEETAPMLRGKLLEPVALQLLRIQQPTWLLDWNGMPGTLSGKYYRDPIHRLGATPDCFAVDPERGRGVIQVKTVNSRDFRKKWFAQEDEEGFVDSAQGASPPLWIAVQAILEAHLTGAQWAAVAPLVIGYGLDMPIIDVPIHTGIIDRLRQATAEFWDRIARNEPPPPDYARDGETIAALYGQDNGREIDLRGDNALPGVLEERENMLASRKAAQDRLNAIKAELTHKLGENVAGFLPGWEITNKLQHRKAYDVKATSYRVLRTKRV